MPPLPSPPGFISPGTTSPGSPPSSSGPGGLPSVEDILGPGGDGGGPSGGGSSSISSNHALQIILKRNPKWKPYLPLLNGLADELDVDKVYLLAAVVARNPSPDQLGSFARAFANALRRYGTLDGAFAAVAPNAKRRPSRIVPGRYVGGRIDLSPSSSSSSRTRAPKLTPEQQVALSIYKSTLREELTNPWVVIKDGKIKFVSNTKSPGKPPKGSLGIRRDDFLSARADLTEMFQAYIGRKPTNGEVAMILKKGWSEFQIKNWLSKRPNFTKGAVWRQSAPGLVGIARDILGDAWNSIPSSKRKDLLRRAIVEGWDQATFAEKLRQLPQYVKGNEFKTNVASLMGVYEQIYGIPQGDAIRTIEEAAYARWTPDQFGAWLRAQPGYTSSGEYLAKAMHVLDALGAIAGGLPALRPGTPAPSPYPSAGPGPPDSKLIPGSPSPPSNPATVGLVPGFA
jgi:hypothetical protein